jgi:hypothetical protein
VLSSAATPGFLKMWPSGPEIELPAGDVTVGVVRIGDTVRRPHEPTSAIVEAYLDHLASMGFVGAPRYLGRDDQDRDVLDFIDGDVAGDPVEEWAAQDVVLPSIARLVRRLHDASADWTPDIDPGRHQPGRPQPTFPDGEPKLVSHRDVTPQNVVFRDGEAYALVDFDLTGWTTRSIDLANTASHWIPMSDPADRDPVYAHIDVGRRLRLLLDSYGRDAVSAELLLEACELRFAGTYDSMRWAAENLGGGWQRMWDEGVGEKITRRVEWFAAVRGDLLQALAD